MCKVVSHSALMLSPTHWRLTQAAAPVHTLPLCSAVDRELGQKSNRGQPWLGSKLLP